MKKGVKSRQELLVHEAGHLVAIATMREFKPATFVWHRLSDYEIAHIEPIEDRKFNWEDPADRNELIVKRSVVALAGGAAADLCLGERRRGKLSLRDIYELVGAVDFELAHEWLTLQRYDPAQCSIEREIKRLFLEVRELLAIPVHLAAINVIAERLLEYLPLADAAGDDFIELSAQTLLEGVVIHRSREFMLNATLHRNRIR